MATFAAFDALQLEKIAPNDCVVDPDKSTVTFELPALVAGRQYGLVLDFTNGLHRPLKAKDVEISCGCIKAFVSSERREAGETFRVRLAFSVPDGDGVFRKRMVLHLEEGPPVYLYVGGTGALPFRVSPDRLDTSALSVGQDVEFSFRPNKAVDFDGKELRFGLRSDFLAKKDARVAKDGTVVVVATVSEAPTDRSIAFAVITSSAGKFEKKVLLFDDFKISVVPRFVNLAEKRDVMLLGSHEAIARLSGKSLEIANAKGEVIGRLEPKAAGRRLLRYEIVVDSDLSSVGEVGLVREIGFSDAVASISFVAD